LKWSVPLQNEGGAKMPKKKKRKTEARATHVAARPMKVVTSKNGEAWLCDKEVDEKGDLKAQGCWRCGDLAFTRND
jgi:hypothetical protein